MGIRNFFIRLIAIGISGSMLASIFADGKGKRIISAVVGLALLLTSVDFFAKIDWNAFKELAEGLENFSYDEKTAIPVDNTEIMSSIIKQQTETYILDKADEMGLKIAKAEIEMSEENGTPYPAGVSITGAISSQERWQLSALLKEDLAIAPEQQRWIMNSRD